MIVALIALVAALAGTAVATVDRLSGQEKKEVKKIAKKVAKRFAPMPVAIGPAGPPGKDGATGAMGPSGATGPTGPTGAEGFAETLPSEATLRGVYAGRGISAVELGITFSPALPADPEFAKVKFLAPSDPRPAGCPSTNADESPEADPGWICVYQTNSDEGDTIGSKTFSYSRFGITLSAQSTTPTGSVELSGRWAASAP